MKLQTSMGAAEAKKTAVSARGVERVGGDFDIDTPNDLARVLCQRKIAGE